MKHLYIILGPVYFFYLLHRFCFTPAKENKEKKRFSIMRFLILGFAVASTLVLHFVPFIMQENPKEQMLQIFNRLFPFQRGLVHDYWAGNIWALYLFLEKILSFVARKMYPNKANQFAFPEIQPKHSVLLLFFSLIPACVRAWKAANSSSKSQKDGQDKLLACILYSAMSSFMLAYHVHEKAIMTAVIPMSFLAFFSIEYARLYLRLSAFGHFGLLPLLPRPHEVCVKFLLYICHLALSTWILSNHFSKRDGEKEEPATMLTKLDKLGLGLIIFQFLYSEFLHSVIFGKGVFEFLPLMMTSILCSMGLFYCWLRSFSMIL
jgi:alpha-1,3-glucosyltransferase